MKIYERSLAGKLKELEKRKEIRIIRGPRQAGKTTLLKDIQRKMKHRHTLFLNLDIPEKRKMLQQNPEDFIKRYRKEGKRLFLFLDEIQRIGSGESLKIIYDEFPDVRIFATGSSSLEIRSKILSFLVGRALVFELFSFSFGEFLGVAAEDLQTIYNEKHASLRRFIENGNAVQKPSFEPEITGLLKEYMIFGGYPEVIKARSFSEKETVLNNIKNLYIEKDITSFFRIEDTGKFEDFVRLLAFDMSSLVSLSSISSSLGITYRKAEEYLSILRNTYIVSLLKSLRKSMVTEIKKSQKVYFMDTGLRNSVMNNFSPFDSRSDQGPLAENYVFRQLVTEFPGWEMKFWRTTGKAEVDFVISKGEETVPVEVKLGGKIERGFHSFLSEYRPKRAVVATLDKFGKKMIGSTEVMFVPIWYF